MSMVPVQYWGNYNSGYNTPNYGLPMQNNTGYQQPVFNGYNTTAYNQQQVNLLQSFYQLLSMFQNLIGLVANNSQPYTNAPMGPSYINPVNNQPVNPYHQPAVNPSAIPTAAVSEAEKYVGLVGNGSQLMFTNGNQGAWCASFVSYVYDKATGGNTPWGYYTPNRWNDPWVSDIRQWGINQGLYTPNSSEAKPGDIIIFDYDPKNNGDHVGIIESVRPDGTINTIEGNVDNQVVEKSYSPNAIGIDGIIKMNEYFGRMRFA